MPNDPFYKTKAWRKLRAMQLKRFPWCAVKGCGQKAQHVDHVETIRDAPHRRLDITNLQSLCAKHHSSLTNAYDMGTIAGLCDAEGYPLDPNAAWNMPDNRSAIRAVNGKRSAMPQDRVRFKLRIVKGKA